MSPVPNTQQTESQTKERNEAGQATVAAPRKKAGTKAARSGARKAAAARKTIAGAHAKGKGKSLRAAAPGSNGKAKAKTVHGVVCPTGRFWNAKRVAIVSALRKLGADTGGAARTPEQIAARSGGKVEPHNVVRYCADTEPLVAGGLVKKAVVEGKSVTCYYLSRAGMTCPLED